MKARYILAVFCGMLLYETSLPAQTEEFRFKLYMESLSTGKKDTLEFGVGPNGYGWGGNSWNGWHDCEYDTALCPIYTEPFFDTVEHIGAFIVPGANGYRHRYDTLRVLCPFYAKKRIGILRSDMVAVFPASEQPVKISWDKVALQNPIIKTPILTTFEGGSRYDAIAAPNWTPIKVIMSSQSECVVGYNYEGDKTDSIAMLAYIQDSMGDEHPYVFFFILTGQNRSADIFSSMQQSSVSIYPNPVKGMLFINSNIDLRKWQVYTVSGKLICSGNSNKQSLDCSRWKSGVYILLWKNINNETGIFKFIK